VTVPGGGASRTIDVTIPKGVRSGQRIRAAGQGPGGGDLYLVVQISPHSIFTRQGDDIVCEVAIPAWTAALGGVAHVPTLGGQMTMTIPAGSRDGRTFRLRGQGMPHVRGEGRRRRARQDTARAARPADRARPGAVRGDAQTARRHEHDNLKQKDDDHGDTI